jgi:hypothetical protein
MCAELFACSSLADNADGNPPRLFNCCWFKSKIIISQRAAFLHLTLLIILVCPFHKQGASKHTAQTNTSHKTSSCLLSHTLPACFHAQIETWEVSKQRPGPKWKLEQFFIYWHARQAHVAKEALGDGKQPTAAAGTQHIPHVCTEYSSPASRIGRQ